MELVAEGVDPRALVLLDGFADDAEGPGHDPRGPGERTRVFSDRPDRAEARPCGRIFVYALNVVRLAGNFDTIEREVTLALEREITATFLEAEQAERPERELN